MAGAKYLGGNCSYTGSGGGGGYYGGGGGTGGCGIYSGGGGGSSYTANCVSGSVISKGVTPTHNIATSPSTTSSVTGYITGVGVGSSSVADGTSNLPSPGGNGLILITYIYSAVDLRISSSGTYTIPASVTAMDVNLWGAGGSGSGYFGTGNSPYAGGSGSYVSCRLAITGPGPTTITVIVGQGGRAPAYSATGTSAIGGGGRGVANSSISPGGGGGRSTIKNPSNTAEDWVTAGGGGGGGKTDIVCNILVCCTNIT